MADWDKIHHRGRVDDRRGMSPVAVSGGVGIVGLLLVAGVAFLGGGEQALQLLEVMNNTTSSGSYSVSPQDQSKEFAGEDEYETFAATVVGSIDYMRTTELKKYNIRYTPPTLVLFRQATSSACGGARSSIGPHYCPADSTIYIDETFFDELTRRFGAKGGDVAEAYVIAHEIGHHIQNLDGTNKRVRQLQARDPRNANEYSVKMELQADCYAGMRAHSIRNDGVFERNEILEAIDAAGAVGDDRIQEVSMGRSNPETWTHGSSAQRQKWFLEGYEYGSYQRCDTFT